MNRIDLTNRIDLAGGHLVYADVGEGDPVVLLHGGGVDHRMWDAQVESLRSQHRVIVPDLRGHGESSSLTKPLRHCDDVAVLVRQLDAGPVVLIGLSMGGGAATDTVLEYPELVRGIVVSGTATSIPRFNDPWVLTILHRWQQAIEQRDPGAYIDASLAFCAGPLRQLDDVAPHVVEQCRAMLTDTLRHHASPDSVLPSPVPDAWERLHEINVPVLSLCGALDSIDHRTMGQELVHGVVDGEYLEIPQTAHYPNLERPIEWNNVIQQFLERIPD